ncbi:GLUG motif-containing protein [Pseudoflavonifractor sp. HCP28S3_F10]|uniref:GLUG motif-containing protein n=1 Tax=Pseudoflavonifractor sp. HCP28S3_F10 TaxID=3438947 RepID=UPI003F8AC001
MKTHKRSIRLLSAALAFLLILSLVLPYAALAAESPVISIRSAEDLIRLAQNCTLDTWSRGKTVTLEADIDLSGTDLSPIPTFGGTFEGNGHTISGLSLQSGASYQGLFRYIQEGAVVRDLHVAGTVSAVGEQTCVGGIAGSNKGTLLDCSFQGTVEGKRQVGGIAGINEAAGSIYRCTAEGSVTGGTGTGGIAGHNAGTITGCTNKSAVNTVHQEKEQSLEDGFSSLNREEVLDTTTDTGGIAGFSNGVVRSCRNTGTIGYPHVGYNVGGVAGRSSGYLENCVNTGIVKGRKDVGGIAGQIAPDIRLIFSPDTIDELKDELDRLSSMVDDALDHTEGSKNTLSDRLDRLSDYTRSATDSASDLADIMSTWADSSIDTVNDASNTLADTLDQLGEITSNAEDILDTMADGMDVLEDSLDQMSAAMGRGADGLDTLSEATDRFRSGLRQARSAFEDIRQAARGLSNALVVEDQEAAERALQILKGGAQDLSAALDDCSEAVEELCRLLEEGEWDPSELPGYLTACLYLLRDSFDAAAATAATLVESIAAALDSVSLDWGAVQQSIRRTVQALGEFSSFCDTMDSSMEKLRDALSQFADMSVGMEDAMSTLSDAMDLFEEGTRELGNTADEIHSLFDDLSSRDPVEFDKLGDDFHQAEDGLHSAVTGISDQMDLLRDEMDASGDTLSGDIRDLGDQFQLIADLLLDAFSDARDTDSGELWSDVSAERISSTTLGKARGCANLGAVEGDLNVGGITGAMAVEHDFDPEDDITEVGEKSFDFRYETRAILQECVNHGPVTAKKDAAGGAVGRMDLGYVLGCENYGFIQSTDGDYVGGIAGTSRSIIRSCWSKSTLSGGSYVGGIAGYGCEIYQCVSLTSVEDSEGYTGSVAGEWDRENGAISANRFVEGPLAGVDGISYAGQAEPVAYADLIQEENVPSPFHSFTLTYMVEDEIMETVHFSYGDALSTREAPEVPDKEGYYGVWEDIGETHITIDHVINAVYTPCLTTLASDAMRDSAHAVLLVEGVFDGRAALRAEPVAQTEELEQWSVTLTGTNDAQTHTVRFTPPAQWRKFSLSLRTEEGSTPLQWDQDGSCCVFTAAGTSFTLEASRQRISSPFLWPVLAIGSCAAAMAMVCFFVIRKRRLKKTHRAAAAHK